ncbi:GcvT family protein [Yoonia sediminilitoris]|uniref:Dimethylglycine dehydrogenase n=1 Tax=Yoonia sediminilitoris TaxID=1286148 RepID=A0A2T6KK22_9RHOB|nr:FAD-dependent oxidoreductase [Yoonia sediminilitoris]PUB16272.1 dimethylglycine dehydrogenase [Yoonia sediminilitoris]RCW96621.1 dimethylglycine dehydrogenase [Yoonia sediminilitoris]
MKTSYRAVVIGGGVVGASVLYHLTKLGWSDVALIERAELTAGSTWHAAAGFHAFNGDPNIAALQDYTINLYKTIESESGQDVGLHMTGGVNIATNQSRWEQLQASWATFKAMGIETARLVTPAEVHDLTGGVIRTDDVLGGLWDDNEGYLDPNGTTHAYAGAAKKRGAEVILRNRVLELHHRPDGTWDVVTEKGTINAEHVVNAGGLWAKQCGLMAGVDLPVTPMEHHYLITDDLEGIKALPGGRELPVIADLDGFTYARQERQGLLLGVYERNPKHWNMDGAPWDYGMELIPEDIDRIAEELGIGFDRYPELANAGIRKWVNGAFTFAPDGNPLVGPVGPRGYWVACGVMAGFSQGGGVGKSLAEWMIHGAPENDIYGMDVARFGPHQSNKEYIRQTTGQFYARRFVVTYPNEQLPAGRNIRLSGAYQDMTAAGARWGNLWGLEVPLYFAAQDFEEPGTLRRSANFSLVAAECAAVRDAAGLLDISGYARYKVTGPQARQWLDRLLACDMPATGQIKLAPMLHENGRLMGDLTVFQWEDGSYWLMGSYGLRAFHMRWFRDHLENGVQIDDISDATAGFSLSGPKAREILQSVAEVDLSTLGMMQCGSSDLGLHRVAIARLSLSGELAYEINCPACEHASLRKLLLDAGAAHGIKEIGFAAMLSMRLEKSIGIWNAEFTQGYTPAMTGLDRWIAWDKGDFIGKTAAASAPAPDRMLTMLQIDADGADAVGFEPVWKDGAVVGVTTSGGYGHRLGQSLALALIDNDARTEGLDIAVHVMGELRPAKVIAMSPYDPTGARMRA